MSGYKLTIEAGEGSLDSLAESVARILAVAEERREREARQREEQYRLDKKEEAAERKERLDAVVSILRNAAEQILPSLYGQRPAPAGPSVAGKVYPFPSTPSGDDDSYGLHEGLDFGPGDHGPVDPEHPAPFEVAEVPFEVILQTFVYKYDLGHRQRASGFESMSSPQPVTAGQIHHEIATNRLIARWDGLSAFLREKGSLYRALLAAGASVGFADHVCTLVLEDPTLKILLPQPWVTGTTETNDVGGSDADRV